MQYIGNKQSLVSSIHLYMDKHNVKGDTFLDLFAGTHSVGKYFKEQGFTVYANDWQFYSFVCGKALIENHEFPAFSKLMELEEIEFYIDSLFAESYPTVLNYLNHLPPKEGFVYRHYCPGGTKNDEFVRLYFKDENGKKFDAIRMKLNEWREKELVTKYEYYILLYGLIRDMDLVANTTSVYGAYLKNLKKAAQKDLVLKPIELFIQGDKHKVYHDDALKIAQTVSSDITYLDPPYNTRQYSSNYHVLETMALYDNPVLKGKTGLRDYDHQKSDFSSKVKVKKAFQDIIEALQTKFIVFSYNNEGILSHQDIMDVLHKKGEVILEEIDYKRFKADKESDSRQYTADRVKELVYICKVK